MSRSSIVKQDGFTFIEILVVMTIMTLALSITIPAIWKGLSKTKFNTFVREMSSTFRYARSRAISTKSKVTISVNLNTNSYTFKEHPAHKIKKVDEDDLVSLKDDQLQTDESSVPFEEERTEVTFEDVPYDIVGFRISKDDQLIKEGTISVNFFPLGNSDGGEFIIGGKQENFFYIVAVDQITGRVTIREERTYY